MFFVLNENNNVSNWSSIERESCSFPTGVTTFFIGTYSYCSSLKTNSLFSLKGFSRDWEGVPWVGLWFSQNTLSRLEKLICSGWKTTLTTSAWPVIPAEHNFCEFTRHKRSNLGFNGEIYSLTTRTTVDFITNIWGPSKSQLLNIFHLSSKGATCRTCTTTLYENG